MKIVVLDGYTLNPGDLSWDKLGLLGALTVHDRTAGDRIIERAADAEIVYTNKTPLGEKEFSNLPKLKFVGVLATGYNVVDVDAAKKRGIVVANIPTYGTASVAQMTFALLLELCNHVQEHATLVRQGKWSQNPDFCFWNYPLIELAGKTMGIIGFGKIGQLTGDIATAFGMNIIAFDTHKTDQSKRTNFKYVELDELFKTADVVSLNCPLFPENKGIVNKTNLGKMKKTALLVNTARGPLVVDQDLADALNTGVIAGAGLDVLSVEPPLKENPLLSARNCIVTPHIAWATFEARSRLMDIAVENLKAFVSGNPVNVVNK